MPVIPAQVLIRLRAALLDCGPFDSDQAIRNVFVHALLKPWRNSLPQANNPASRVDAIVAFLADRSRADTRANALVCLLKVLTERTDPEEECHQILGALAEELEQLFTPREVGLHAAPAPSTPAAASHLDEIESLTRRRAALRRNLLIIRERKVDFIDPRSVPPDLDEAERNTSQELGSIQLRLAELEGSSAS